MPSPEQALARYADAIERGDVEALYSMMNADSRRTLSRQQLSEVLSSQKEELTQHAAALRAPERSLRAHAEVRFADGEIVALTLRDGAFKLSAADALPAAARTPEQALGQLRRVLARRSYPGLLRLLSPATRAAVERDVRALVTGLIDPDALLIEVVGDRAVVEVPGEHQVRLKRQHGIWHVEDFY